LIVRPDSLSSERASLNERTMMAWIRTGTSLITFGFSIYKLFQLEGLGHPQPGRIIGPREFAFMLVSIGLISLLLATIEQTGGRLIKYAGYYWLVLAESHLTRRLFAGMLRKIAALPSPVG
jgi:uncharacterized membrane protein YidH (DUF202 family)